LNALYASFTVISPAPEYISRSIFSKTAAAFEPGPFPVIKISGFRSKRSLEVFVPPLDDFLMEIIDDRLFILKAGEKRDHIKPGTELISINNVSFAEILQKYRPCISFDGFNNTYIDDYLCVQISSIFALELGGTKKYMAQLNYNGQIKTVDLAKKGKKGKKRNLKNEAKLGYNEYLQDYSKELSFIVPDSSIAVLKVRDFIQGEPFEAYNDIFSLLDTLKTPNLILDLRDNLGGTLNDAMQLFAFLADTSFIFAKKSELTSKESIKEVNYFKGYSLPFKVLLALNYPIHLFSNWLLSYTIEETDGKYYAFLSGSGSYEPRSNAFKGQLYVIINESTFSVASFIAANLKQKESAIFVGQETGGASNGAVAGKMNLTVLPNSKLKLIFGIASLKPGFTSDEFGRGVVPHIKIIPTIQDLQEGKDPEIEWILDDITKGQAILVDQQEFAT